MALTHFFQKKMTITYSLYSFFKIILLIGVCLSTSIISLNCVAEASETSKTSENNQTTLTGRDIALLMNKADNSVDMHRNAIMVIERGKQKLLRKMEMWSIHTIDGRKSLIRFTEPVDIRDTKFLSWTWDDVTNEDDLWIFLPQENLTRRISGGGKKSSFMRSSFALEDIEYRSPDADEHTLLREELFNNRDTWVIESKAVLSKQSETSYSRRVVYVDKEYHLPVKTEYYDRNNKLVKTLLSGAFENYDGIWSATKLIMTEEGKDARTMLQYTDVIYNQGLKVELFDQSSLKR